MPLIKVVGALSNLIPKSDKAGEVTIALAFTRLFVLFLGVEVTLVFLRKKTVWLAAAGLIGAHLLGFTAIDAFGEMQSAKFFSQNIGQCFVALIIAVVVLIVMCALAKLARQRFVHAEGSTGDSVVSTFSTVARHDWDHQCEHTEDEAMAFGFGLLISQLIRFSILGYLPPLDGSHSKKKGGHILLLLTAAMGMSLLVVVLGFVKESLPKINLIIQRALGLLQATAAMSMAWCLVFWLKWVFKTHGKGLLKYSSKMYVLFWMAMIWTTLGFGVICIIDKVSSQAAILKSRGNVSGLRSLVGAWILLIGLSWEKSFIQAIDGLQMSRGGKVFSEIVRLALLLFVIPAWLFFMLPRTPMMQNHGHGHEEHHDEHEHGEHAHGEECTNEWRLKTRVDFAEYDEHGEYADGELHHDGIEYAEDDYAGEYEQHAGQDQDAKGTEEARDGQEMEGTTAEETLQEGATGPSMPSTT